MKSGAEAALVGRERPRWIAAVALGLIAAVTLVHYATDMQAVAFHNVYRRLYYLPIVLAAFAHGLRGGVGAAGLASAAYLPHAFFMAHRDPAPPVDKGLEIALYFAVGALTGWLVERQRRVQRQLEASLTERDALAGQLVRAGKLSALGELTAGLAHELRNPLASILGSAEALAAEFPADHRKHRLGQLMLREIDRLDRVVTDFLEFARPTTPTRQRVDMRGLLEEVVGLARHHRDADAVRFQIEVDPNELELEVDPDQMTQVLLNLTLNATQALFEGEPEAPTITYLAREREVGTRRRRCLGVRDNGPGVDPAHLEEIFHPYFTTRPEGSGLGLSLSARMIEAHGGFLDVESEPGQTTFWICFEGQGGLRHES